MAREFLLVSGMMAVIGCILSGSVWAGSQWRIDTPYPNNPLKVAVLSGDAVASRRPFPVTLEFACHPGAAVPRLVFRVPLMVADWDFRALESSSGARLSTRSRILTVRASNDRVLERPLFTGLVGANSSFMFNWQPDEALLKRLLVPGDGIKLRLRGSRRAAGILEARFVMPTDPAPMISVLAPCSRAMAARLPKEASGAQ